MSAPTFIPPIDPSVGTSERPVVSLNKAEFGDGYSQASPKGIQHIKRKLALRWEVLDAEDKALIAAFFTERGGYLPFLYRLPGEAVALRFTCAEWEFASVAPHLWRCDATLEQTFGAA